MPKKPKDHGDPLGLVEFGKRLGKIEAEDAAPKPEEAVGATAINPEEAAAPKAPIEEPDTTPA